MYDPAGIILSFKNHEDALFKPLNKVLIDNRQTECFFKPCNSSVQVKQELKAYKMILAARLGLSELCTYATYMASSWMTVFFQLDEARNRSL